MDIYFIRHGETDWNVQRKVQGRSDIPLNDYGRELAYATKKGLEDEGVKFDKAFCSPLIRAVETAKILLEDTDIEPIPDPRLIEIDFGEYEGFSIPLAKTDSKYAEFGKCFNDPANYHPKSGEDFEALYARSRSFVNEVLIPLENKTSTVLVAAHGALIRGILNVIEGLPVTDFWKKVQANCSVNYLKLENGSFTTVYESRLFYEPLHPYYNPEKKG